MAHARQQIKSALVSVLNGLPTTGTSVFSDEAYPLDPGTLPALIVRTEGEERIDEWGGMGDLEARALTISVDAISQDWAGLSAELDQICLEVEGQILSDGQFLAPLYMNCHLERTDFEINGDGDQPVGTAKMEWVFSYQINRLDPETIIG